MIKVIVFANFERDITLLMNNYLNVFCKGKDNYLDKISFTDKQEEATHAIVLNETKCPLDLPKENVIGFAVEPLENLRFNNDYFDYVKNNLRHYIIGCDLNKENFINHYSFMWTIQNRDKYFESYQYPKKHAMSIILSKANTHFGHKYRRVLVHKILESDLDIHIYGNGTDRLKNNRGRIRRIIKDRRIKGSFIDYEPYLEYHYTIAIENTRHDSYISEKFTQPIATNCVPIYWGARKVEDYFGKNCCYKLSGNLNQDFDMIKDIYNNYQKRLLDLKEARFNHFEGNAYLMKYLKYLWG